MKISKKVLAFIAIDIACFLTVLDSTIINVSLPSMAKYFHTSTTGISWVSTAYLIAFSSLLINFAKIADIFGRKKLFLIGLIIFGASSVCCGLVNSLGLLITFRILQGVGAAILTPLTIPLGIELFHKESMGRLSVIVGMTISISAASGPLLGGILNETFSYRAIFYVNIPFVILALIFGSLYVRECYDETIEKKIDVIGCILLAMGLGTLTFLLVKGNDFGWFSVPIAILVAITICSMLAFVLYERRIKNPMIDFSLFKIRSFTSSIILIAVFFFAYMPVSYLMNFYFENTLGYSVLRAGLMMGIPSVTALLITPLMPFLLKKMAAKTVSIISVFIAAAGNMMFVFMNPTNHMLMVCISFIMLGIGVRFTTILYQTAFEEVDNSKNGIASGIQNSMRQLTACIAIALVSTLSSYYTTEAVNHVKEQIITEITNDQVLDQQIKTPLIMAIQGSTKEDNAYNSKNKVHLLFQQKEQQVMKNMTTDHINIIKAQFHKQEIEVNTILDKLNSKKTQESYRVYNKCFLIMGLIALLGLIAVPFNKKRVVTM